MTVAFPSPATAEIVDGAEAAPCGVNGVELLADVEFPMLFTATTANVYGVPFVNPVHV